MKQHTTDRMAELEWNFMHAPECPDSYDNWEDCGEDYDKFIAEFRNNDPDTFENMVPWDQFVFDEAGNLVPPTDE